MRRALVSLMAVGLLTTACASGTGGSPESTTRTGTTKTSTSRAPFTGERLDDGEVVKVEKLDGIRLESPDEGELRNYGVAVDIVDFGTGEVVDVGVDQQYGAQEDSTLLAFRIRVTPLGEDLDSKVTATVSVDGRQRSLPDFEYALSTPGEDQTLQYLVAVPNDRREVELELKYADLAQQFDLLEGERTGEQPDILYRSKDAPTVYVENLTPSSLPVTAEDQEPGAYVVGVTRAELTYFAPPLGKTPGDKGEAWLVLTYEPTGEGTLEHDPPTTYCQLPFAVFTLTAGTRTYPVVEEHSAMEAGDTEKVLVFEVPSDLTAATLTVQPQSFTCSFAGFDDTFAATGPATVEVELPED